MTVNDADMILCNSCYHDHFQIHALSHVGL
jgi:hypothetical protein